MPGIGICLLTALTNVTETPQFLTMKDLIKVIAGSKGLNAELQIELYKQLGSVFFDFKCPIILKEAWPEFIWYSCLIIEHISFEEIN